MGHYESCLGRILVPAQSLIPIRRLTAIASIAVSSNMVFVGLPAIATHPLKNDTAVYKPHNDLLIQTDIIQTNAQVSDQISDQESSPAALIPMDEIPEEILRTEIITEARSPLTGEPLSAAEYAQLQAEVSTAAGTPLVSEDLRYLIFLLQVRRALKPIVPFL
ncbi:MAG: hypothetical protein AAFN12_01025 [Cyanobacteria bacterium J06560_2]